MSKEIQRYISGASTLAKTDQSFQREAGGALVKTGAAGLAVWGVAGLIPFVTFPMLLVLMVVAGGMFWLKGND